MRRAVWLLARGAESLSRQVTQPVAQELRPPVSQALAGARWSHCACSGDMSLLGKTQKVIVEYAKDEVDNFVAFADAVEEEFEGVLVDGVEVEGRANAFDVKLEDGQLIYSNSSSSDSASSLPEYSDLFERLRQAGLQASVA